MTDFKALIREGAEASQLMAPGDARDLIARLVAALEKTHEVAAGADHTAAKYWRRMREAEVAAGVAEDRVKRAEVEALNRAATVIADLRPNAVTVLTSRESRARDAIWWEAQKAVQVLVNEIEKEAGA